MNYQEATAELGNRESRKLENNTYLQRRDASTVAVKLHETDVVTFHADGRVVMSSGGWKTPTTKARINSYAPVAISQANGVWYVRNGSGEEVTFADGITYRDGKLTHAGPAPEKQQADRLKVRKFAERFIAALVAGKIPHPSAGDCWYCSMKEVETGKPIGECFRDADHIRSHMSAKERYFVPSMLVNAMKATGAGPAWFNLLNAFWKENWENEDAKRYREPHGLAGHLPKHLKRWLTRYLYQQLGYVR